MKIPFFVALAIALALAACASSPAGPAISQSPLPGGGLHVSAEVPVSGTCVVREKDIVLTIQGANVTGNDDLKTPLHGTADANHFAATGSNISFGRAMTLNVTGDIADGKVTKIRIDEQKGGGICGGEVQG